MTQRTQDFARRSTAAYDHSATLLARSHEAIKPESVLLPRIHLKLAQGRRLRQRNNFDTYPGVELPCFSIRRTGEF
jgi:hypothetical protein